MYPFNEQNIKSANKGDFTQKKIDKIVVELAAFEVLNDCYYATLKDFAGDTIQATFHNNCKEKIKKKLKKGSVLLLKNVSSLFSQDSNVLLGSCFHHQFRELLLYSGK